MPLLHDYVLSDDCYAVRLLLSLLGLRYDTHAVDYFPGAEHRSEPFLQLNPRGTLPVLEDDGLVIADTGAILCHLANSYDRSGTWLPRDFGQFGPVLEWVGFASGPLQAMFHARLASMLGLPGDLDQLRRDGRRALRILEDHLTDRAVAGGDWLVGDMPTIADIAVFPKVALSHDAGIGLEDYPALHLWQRRIRKLDGFVGMPGIPDYF